MEDKETIDLAVMPDVNEPEVMDPETEKALLDTVLDKLEYQFIRDMLVKPLPEIMVEKEIIKPIPTNKFDSALEVPEYETEKNIETVPANFRRGVVLSLPTGYEWPDKNRIPQVGDVIAYAKKGAMDFDLFKDSQIVNPYNVVAFIRK